MMPRPDHLARIEKLATAALDTYIELVSLAAEIKADGPATSFPLAPAEAVPADNPLAVMRSRLGMSRGQFAIHLGMNVETIKDVERGRPMKLMGRWEVALERAGYSYAETASAYRKWRDAATRASVGASKVTQIGRTA